LSTTTQPLLLRSSTRPLTSTDNQTTAAAGTTTTAVEEIEAITIVVVADTTPTGPNLQSKLVVASNVSAIDVGDVSVPQPSILSNGLFPNYSAQNNLQPGLLGPAPCNASESLYGKTSQGQPRNATLIAHTDNPT